MMNHNEATNATLEQLTDELAAAGWDSTQQTRDEAFAAVLALFAETIDEIESANARRLRSLMRHATDDQRRAVDAAKCHHVWCEPRPDNTVFACDKTNGPMHADDGEVIRAVDVLAWLGY
jgi:hypothetical protein